MGLTSFATFQALLKNGHASKNMGFQGTNGQVNVFANRMRVARSFRGIQLDGYTDATTLGYNAFFQVFLTHGALECYAQLIGADPAYSPLIADALQRYAPEPVIQTLIRNDADGRLCTFILSKLKAKTLREIVSACQRGESTNVVGLSAAIRHIFAHGELTAHANRINPQRVHGICMTISDFLLDFMDREFTRQIDAYCTAVGFEQRPTGGVDDALCVS
jgi:hypothetical protein